MSGGGKEKRGSLEQDIIFHSYYCKACYSVEIAEAESVPSYLTCWEVTHTRKLWTYLVYSYCLRQISSLQYEKMIPQDLSFPSEPEFLDRQDPIVGRQCLSFPHILTLFPAGRNLFTQKWDSDKSSLSVLLPLSSEIFQLLTKPESNALISV